MCVWGVAMACTWKSDDTFWESVVFFHPCETQGLNSGLQAWHRAPLSTRPSHQPHPQKHIFKMQKHREVMWLAQNGLRWFWRPGPHQWVFMSSKETWWLIGHWKLFSSLSQGCFSVHLEDIMSSCQYFARIKNSLASKRGKRLPQSSG